MEQVQAESILTQMGEGIAELSGVEQASRILMMAETYNQTGNYAEGLELVTRVRRCLMEERVEFSKFHLQHEVSVSKYHID